MRASVIAAAATALVAPAIAADPVIYKNAFSYPGITDAPPAGKPYNVVWEPTKETPYGSCDDISLVLLSGPDSGSLTPLTTLVSDYPNNGTYTWDVSTDLNPDTKYGIELICKVSKTIQYTVLFSIQNPDYKPTQPSSTSSLPSYGSNSSSSTADATTAAPSTLYTTAVVTKLTTYCPEATTLAINDVTYTITSATWLTITDCPCTVTHPITHAASTKAMPTPYPIPHSNATTVYPTGSVSMPASLTTVYATSLTTDVSPGTPTADASSTVGASEGAASSLKTSFVGGFVAIVAAALLL